MNEKRSVEYIAWHKKWVSQWQKNNPKKMKKYHGDYAKRRYEMMALIKNRPCQDCHGWFEACQMDFDHTKDNKIRNIGNLLRSSLKILIDEIKKCDLVCANCHRLRTYRRFKLKKMEGNAMKTLVAVLLITLSTTAHAISNCYLYSEWPDKQAQCEREYLGRKIEQQQQDNNYNQVMGRIAQDQANAQAADNAIAQQNQMDALIRIIKSQSK